MPYSQRQCFEQREGVHCPYEPPDTLQNRPYEWGRFSSKSAGHHFEIISASNASKRLLTKRAYNGALQEAILLRTISVRPGDFSFFVNLEFFKTSLSDVHAHSLIHTTHDIVAEPSMRLSLLRGRRRTRFAGPTHQSLYSGGYYGNRKQHTL